MRAGRAPGRNDTKFVMPPRGAAGLQMPTTGPLHLEATVRVLQRRPTNPVEIWAQGRYLRVFATADGHVLTAVQNRGSIDAPDVRCTFLAGEPSAATRRALAQRTRATLGLDVDTGPLQRAAERIPGLRPTARALRGMRPPRFPELFDAFVNVIPFQQLSLDAGAAIVGRLVQRFGSTLRHADRSFAIYPRAGVIADARVAGLIGCGLSRSKAEALRHVAKVIANGELTEDSIARLDTSDALKALTELPGIGPWSAAVLLLRGFGRLEVFPPGDSGALRGLTTLLKLRSPASLERVVERFGAYRGYLYFCGLGSSLLAKHLIEPAPPAAESRGRKRPGLSGRIGISGTRS